MHLPPFTLDRWLNDHHFADPPPDFDLGSSTGPPWTLAELLALDSSGRVEARLRATKLLYANATGRDELRNAIADFHGAAADHVLVTTGAAEALSAVFCLAAEPGSSIVLPDPAFPGMLGLAAAWGYRVRSYRLRREAGYEARTDDIVSNIDAHTRIVLVNSPHNPTGAVMPRQELEALALETGRRGVLLLVDEVYHGIYHGDRHSSAATLDADNVVVVGDASKALSLSGLRIGWIVDRDARRRERLVDIRSYFTVSNVPICEELATLALANRTRILGRAQEVAHENLKILRSFVDAHRDVVAWAPPAGGMTVFPWLVDDGDGREFCEACARRGVLVVPGDCFGWPSHFRLGFGAQATGFAPALDRMADVLNALPLSRPSRVSV